MSVQELLYCVDGHEFDNEESNLAGDGRYAPFRVFDIAAQDYVGPTYSTTDAAMHGVSAKIVPSGRYVANGLGRGETKMMVCYLDGKRTTRLKALERLSLHIAVDESITIEGPLRGSWKLLRT